MGGGHMGGMGARGRPMMGGRFFSGNGMRSFPWIRQNSPRDRPPAPNSVTSRRTSCRVRRRCGLTSSSSIEGFSIFRVDRKPIDTIRRSRMQVAVPKKRVSQAMSGFPRTGFYDHLVLEIT